MYLEETKKKLLLAATVVIMLNVSSCKKYEDGPLFSLRTKTVRLTGEWEVVEIENNDPLDDGKLILEFEKDGDFSSHRIYSDYNYSSYCYSYEGDWEWESGKEVIEIEIDGDKEKFEILRLTNDELWFEDEDGNEWQCEKEK